MLTKNDEAEVLDITDMKVHYMKVKRMRNLHFVKSIVKDDYTDEFLM